MKREESRDAIYCELYCGPIFGDDICISDNCNEEDSCSIENDGTKGYECDHKYKKSLFVKTAGTNEENKFSVFDYEVFGIDYKSKYTIDHLCEHPDIIWKYIKTKDITEKSLKHVVNERGLLNDLDAIHCEDDKIRLKISQYYFKNPSEFLPNTQLVNQQYDSKLREWTGDYKWKLLYRASEHQYSAESFHEYCDNKGSTLIIIKSNGGWIFGGYTTKSWDGESIYIMV